MVNPANGNKHLGEPRNLLARVNLVQQLFTVAASRLQRRMKKARATFVAFSSKFFSHLVAVSNSVFLWTDDNTVLMKAKACTAFVSQATSSAYMWCPSSTKLYV
jgi:hypothetical protein